MLLIRTMRDTDVPFIVSSWLMSNYARMSGKRPVKSLYYKAHQLLIKQALDQDATLIACNKSDEDQIIGWINFGDNYLNYVYVKETFEGLGVCTELIKQTGLPEINFICTHYTRTFDLRHSTKLNIKYNPYLFTNRELAHENKSDNVSTRD